MGGIQTKLIPVMANIIFRPQGVVQPIQKLKTSVIKYQTDYQYLHAIKEQKFNLRSIYNHVIKGRYFYSDVPDVKGIIILAHGYGGMEEEMHLIAPFFLKYGLDVVVYELFEYQNKKTLITFGQRESEDLLKIVAWVKQQNATLPLALYGHSLGANTTLYAAARGKYQFHYVIANAPFNHLDETIASHLRVWSKLFEKDGLELSRQLIRYAEKKWGLSFQKDEMEAQVATIKVPVLYLHGDVDNLNPPYMSEQLFVQTPRAVREILVGANHLNTFTKTKEQMEYTLTLFMNEMYKKGVTGNEQ